MRTHREKVPTFTPAVTEVFEGADLVFANCEGPVLYETIERRPLYTVRYGLAREYLQQLATATKCPLRKWRFSLANNHAGDFGEEGIRRTVDLMRDTGSQFFGFGRTPLREFYGELELDFWGWTQWENRRFDGKESWRPSSEVARLAVSKLPMAAKRLRVLFPHWGLEFRHYPNRAQLDQMVNWLRWDFDLVVGHHSHVVQPIQVVSRSAASAGGFSREAIGCHGVGNLLGAQWSWPTKLLGALEVEVETTGERCGQIAGYQMHAWANVGNGIQTVNQVVGQNERAIENRVIEKMKKRFDEIVPL